MRMRGRNLAESVNESFKFASSNETCIFLSHISIDKSTVVHIGDYILDAGINIYLDVNDAALQRAVAVNDPIGITTCIEAGIEQCSHVMCLVSPNTVKSWWVPYEIGFSKKARKSITTLFLKGIVEIPDYLKVSELLMGTESLNHYLEKIMIPKLVKGVLLENSVYSSSSQQKEGYLIKESAQYHPLDDYLDWNK